MMLRLIRIYTPFFCTLMALLNGVLFIKGETEIPAIHMLASVSGSSIVMVLYMFATSLRMCIWYKLNLLCLLILQLCGLMYNYYGIDASIYLWSVVLISGLGIIFFLMFKIFYRVTSVFGCSRKHSPTRIKSQDQIL